MRSATRSADMPGPGSRFGHDVIMRHIRVRTGVSGQAWRSGWEADALSTVGAYNVIVDHCTFTWALDEVERWLLPWKARG